MGGCPALLVGHISWGDNEGERVREIVPGSSIPQSMRVLCEAPGGDLRLAGGWWHWGHRDTESMVAGEHPVPMGTWQISWVLKNPRWYSYPGEGLRPFEK